MTRNDYNRSGVLGGIASAQNARALHHLPIDLGGKCSVYALANRICAKAARCKLPLTSETPCLWKLEPSQIQIRPLIVAKINNSDGLYAEPRELDTIAIIGQPKYTLA